MSIPEEKPENEEIITHDKEDSDYTEDEVEFADGAGTELDEQIDAADPDDLED